MISGGTHRCMESSWAKTKYKPHNIPATPDDVYTKKPIFNNSSLELVAELNNEIVGILDLEKDNNNY